MPSIETLLKPVVRSVRDRRKRTTHHECRRCGRTVSREASTCTSCGSDEIATFSL